MAILVAQERAAMSHFLHYARIYGTRDRVSDELKSGVYAIINKIDGKRYVGSARNFSERWGVHRSHLRLGKHHNRYLQNAWDKYGSDTFEFAVLLRCPREECLKQEQRIMDEFQVTNPTFGYNLMPRADSNLGIKRSTETKKKLSDMAKKRPAPSIEVRQRISQKLKLLWADPSYKYTMRAKMQAGMTPDSISRRIAKIKGRKASQEFKNKASVRMKSISPELRAKMDKARWAGDAKDKLRAFHLGRKASKETRAKQSLALRGIVFTEERRHNISKGLKRVYSDPRAREALSKRLMGHKVTAETIAKSAATRKRNAGVVNWMRHNLGMLPSVIDWEIKAA